MIRSRFVWVIILIAAALLGTAWIAYSKEDEGLIAADSSLTEAPIPGYLAPDFTLTSTQGEQISLHDFRGQPVILNFWATWCPPCRSEAPHFQDVSLIYNGQAKIIGIDQGEPLTVVADFGASFGLTYPLLLDLDNAINRAYGVTALPTTIFVDSHGVVREVYSGIVNAAVLQDRIQRLLAKN
jgi:cytochrome c biogenesis protein CcmG/thiol:disulfide interchange protein DsbE